MRKAPRRPRFRSRLKWLDAEPAAAQSAAADGGSFGAFLSLVGKQQMYNTCNNMKRRSPRQHASRATPLAMALPAPNLI